MTVPTPFAELLAAARKCRAAQRLSNASRTFYSPADKRDVLAYEERLDRLIEQCEAISGRPQTEDDAHEAV